MSRRGNAGGRCALSATARGASEITLAIGRAGKKEFGRRPAAAGWPIRRTGRFGRRGGRCVLPTAAIYAEVGGTATRRAGIRNCLDPILGWEEATSDIRISNLLCPLRRGEWPRLQPYIHRKGSIITPYFGFKTPYGLKKT